ncbi:MAG: bifunctional UDP-sugar hydrolase/5'-nucleotidase [Elusimicrobiota bacterium]
MLHTNDIHGWIMARPDRKAGGRMVGGAAALARVVKRERGKGGPMLLLDAGDWFQGTPEGTITRGRSVADIFNALEYDAVTLGNHEYDYGEEPLKALIARLEVPVVGSNVHGVAGGGPVDYVKPYIVKEVAGVKVGIFGLLTTRMPVITIPKNVAGLRFPDEVETARRMVAALREAGADVVVALSHIARGAAERGGSLSDRDLAERVSGIDLIVGGHAHVPVFEPERDQRTGTLIVNTGWALTRVGRAVLEIDPERKRVVSSKGELVDLWIDEVGEDPEIRKIVEKYQEEVGRRLEVVIATASVTLEHDREKISSLGVWVTDCIRRWTKTQIAFQNGGGIRADLRAGPVRLRDIFEIMPFDNYVVTLYMSGAGVRSILEHGVSRAPGKVQVSGLRFKYDPDAPAGRRLREVSVGGRPLADDEVYSVSAPDFLVLGGDDYEAFGEGTDKAVTGTLSRDALIWCAQENSPIEARDAGRVLVH